MNYALKAFEFIFKPLFIADKFITNMVKKFPQNEWQKDHDWSPKD